MGNLRAQLGRVICARNSGIACSLLLASGLLAGCNDSSSTSASNAAASMTGPPHSISSSTSTIASSGSKSTGSTSSTSTSPPAATDKSIDVTWTAPTANTNGSALTDLAGYTIYYGTSPTSLTKSVSVANAGATDHVVQGLNGGTWYFAVRAYTSGGLQSSYSAVISRTIT